MKKIASTLVIGLAIGCFSINILAEGQIPTGSRNCDQQNPPAEGCNDGIASQQEPSVFTKLLLEIGKLITFR